MTQAKRVRGGWKDEETALLFHAVDAATEEGKPLRDVFGDVGARLGRKPNSIRNYYYARVRDQPGAENRKPPFRTFDDEELHALLREVLLARSHGESVRACVTRLAGGDRQKMLRYQNKYRSILKGRLELLKQVAEELRAEGYAEVSAPTATIAGGEKYRAALELCLQTGDRALPLLIDTYAALLRRVAEAEQAAAFTPSAETERLERKWLDARRDADRLRVEVDLLKMQLEDERRGTDVPNLED